MEEEKVLTVIFENESESYYETVAFRKILDLQLSFHDKINIVVSKNGSEKLLDQVFLSECNTTYVMCIKESHEFTSDFFKTMVNYLDNRKVYIAEPMKYQAKIPKSIILNNFSLEQKYLRETDSYGFIYNRHRLVEFVKNNGYSTVHTLYVNYRVFYSINKVTPLEVGYTTNNNTKIVNGFDIPFKTQHLLLEQPGNISVELKIYVLRLIILFLRGLRTSRKTSITIKEVQQIISNYQLLNDSLLNRTLLTDKFELLFMKYLSGKSEPSLLFKELDDYYVNIQFQVEKMNEDENLVGLYGIEFADSNVYIYKEYILKELMSDSLDLSKPNFYSTKIDENSVFLFMDRATQADDNAEYLYDYFVKNYPQYSNAYFAIHPKSSDWIRLRLKGFKLVPLWTPDFYEKFLESDVVISSQIYNLDYKGKNFSNSRFVYLQHGVILTEMHDWIISKFFDLFITTGKIEEDYLKILAPAETLNSGLPRYEDLVNQEHEQKNLLYMPTWRFNLNKLDDLNFVESEYFKKINSILGNKQLNEYLNKNDVILNVKLHPNLKSREHLFESSSRVRIVDDSYRSLISTADFVFTDYSSVVIDAAFVDIPIAYYQFDKDTFFDEQPYEQRVDYQTEGLGPLFTKESELVKYITDEVYESDRDLFSKRKNEFFSGVDKSKINKKIIERILAL